MPKLATKSRTIKKLSSTQTRYGTAKRATQRTIKAGSRQATKKGSQQTRRSSSARGFTKR